MAVVLYVRIWPRDGFGGLAGARVEESAEPRRHIKILNGRSSRDDAYYGLMEQRAVQRQVRTEREKKTSEAEWTAAPIDGTHTLQKQWASSSIRR